MAPLNMVMRYKFSNGVSQRILTKEDHLIQTAFFDAADEAFGIRIQICDRGGSLTALIVGKLPRISKASESSF